MEDINKNNYLIDSLRDLEDVFIPSLLFLKDDFFPPSDFPKSVSMIKESMMFYRLFCYGEDEYEKEYFSYREYDEKNKGHHYIGVNYFTLNKSLNFDTFNDELQNKIKYSQFKFIDELNEFRKIPNFEISLLNHLKLLKNSLMFVNTFDTNSNTIFEIVTQSYAQSYIETLQLLKSDYGILYEKPFLIFDDKLLNMKKIYSLNPTLAKKEDNYKLWHYVFEEILNGNIRIVQEGHQQKFYYIDEEFENATNLGNHISQIMGKETSTIRIYLTNSIGVVGKGDKNIFTKKNIKKINKLMEGKENKMCLFFKEKLNELFGTN